MEKINDVNINSNFNKILDPDLTLDEKKIYYEDLLLEATDKNNNELKEEIISILNDLQKRGDDDGN